MPSWRLRHCTVVGCVTFDFAPKMAQREISESKLAEACSSNAPVDLPVVDVRAVEIHPKDSILTGPLGFEIDFSLSRPAYNSFWDIRVRILFLV